MTMAMRLSAPVLAAALFLGVGTAAAHEMFLKADQYLVPPSSEQTIRLMNGTFDKSENSISRDRMQDVSIVANGRTLHPGDSAWSDDGPKTVSYLKYRAGGAGTYVIGVSTRPKILTLPAKEWAEYLKHDGVVDTLAVFEKQNKLAQVRERYSKHVRTVVQVGDQRTTDFARPLGYPVEILLEQNPGDVKQGGEVSFRVLFKGKPVVNQYVKASYQGHHGHDATGNHVSRYELRTDKDGRARFVVDQQTLWYITLIHMRQIQDPGADYESHWATATFSIR